jgi:hypothetical protein
VHGVLQFADLATGSELSAACAAQGAAEGVLGISRQAAYQRFGKRSSSPGGRFLEHLLTRLDISHPSG